MSSQPFTSLRLEQRDRVLTVRYRCPPHNFVTPGCVAELDELTRAVECDRSIGAVVLTGDPDNLFLSHVDAAVVAAVRTAGLPARLAPAGLRALGALLRIPGAGVSLERSGNRAVAAILMAHRWRSLTSRMTNSSLAYLAAINGPALGGGLEIALACDIRYVADGEHVRLGQPEILCGLLPGGGGTRRLTATVGTARAVELLLEGTLVRPQEALALGLVHRIVPGARLIAEAQHSAARLARRSRTAVAAVKRATYHPGRGDDVELKGFLRTLSTRSAQTALHVYLRELHKHQRPPFLADPQPWQDGTKVDFS